jgi:hypothetical protein
MPINVFKTKPLNIGKKQLAEMSRISDNSQKPT